ncbi:hypothetical protein AMR41_20325 [Hapalosiphon sp. MRB220]|nr:hypothetical protein AMR41_20325 [Hapalosiphon sp. MRB220]
MDDAKRERLEAKGWKVGTVTEFLELSPEETALIDIALLVKAMLATGATPKDIAEAIANVDH